MLTMVDACTRDGTGGSPTVVVDDDPSMRDEDRCAIVRDSGASHGAFLSVPHLRFFTGTGELRNCGHGILAAHAVLLSRSGLPEQRLRHRTGDRPHVADAAWRPDGIEVWYDQGAVSLSAPDAAAGVLGALGAPAVIGLSVASPGTPRLLVEVPDVAAVMSVTPDFTRLAAACRERDLLGCFVWAFGPDRSVTARMFAPAIGVDEDVANANSSGCLAAHLYATGRGDTVQVRQGDVLGRPSTVLASTDGRTTRIGGTVRIR
ncbi:PhzF family phenazine biosynthesis protein [Actinoplanes hulinensis]|uniref:PhzF family phenazine biosynthesis protein n=1 Tax=Actinoplanes hulinensis TaxID=1144547 RepID=A0ABS7B4E7_9ACTN|nr:PhzF family phenazine biosynthesis protein [Actinoplanes hulinensis]MBW6435664.1 PhzF family phenazine biosynthesis protein [Actinoplanes hulinensis]